MIPYELNKIKAVVFDVDGVLSCQTVTLHPDGEPLRTVNIKDGYAIQLAVKLGLHIAIITGAHDESVRLRYERLGVKDVYMKSGVKIKVYDKFLEENGLHDDEVIYVGDDVPDLQVLRRVGCPCCPADACADVKDACIYICTHQGGHGCAREILEQVLRVQGKWLLDEKAFGW